jgi:hypothetical protein
VVSISRSVLFVRGESWILEGTWKVEFVLSTGPAKFVDFGISTEVLGKSGVWGKRNRKKIGDEIHPEVAPSKNS